MLCLYCLWAGWLACGLKIMCSQDLVYIIKVTCEQLVLYNKIAVSLMAHQKETVFIPDGMTLLFPLWLVLYIDEFYILCKLHVANRNHRHCKWKLERSLDSSLVFLHLWRDISCQSSSGFNFLFLFCFVVWLFGWFF